MLLTYLFFGALFVVGLLVYFVPTIIAEKRNHDSETLIFILNIALGWTLIGWLGLIVWASEGRNSQNEYIANQEDKWK